MSRLATPAGTADYAREHPAAHGHYRMARELTLSSIGFGSYLGEETPEGDDAYAEAMAAGLRGGVNVLDTAINYRSMRSERAVGMAIRRAGVARERFMVVTKGGFVPVDADSTLRPQDQFDALVDRGVARPDDLVAGCHVMTPQYLADSLRRSLRNLDLDAVDLFLVHNPETQLDAGVPRDAFDAQLLDVFRMLECEAGAGRIGGYGVATWSGLRCGPDRAGHLALETLLALAEDAAEGGSHHLRAIEVPFNLAMPEAARASTQSWRGARVPTLVAAAEAGLVVLGSATLAQGRLLRAAPHPLWERLGAQTPLEAALQFARSTPGLTTALVGTGRRDHAEQNVAVAQLAPRPEAARMLLGSA